MRTRPLVAVAGSVGLAALVLLAVSRCGVVAASVDYPPPSLTTDPSAAPGASLSVTGRDFVVDRPSSIEQNVFGQQITRDRSRPVKDITIVLTAGSDRTTLTTVDAAGDGSWSAAVTVPASTNPGTVTLEAASPDLPRAVTTTLVVGL